MRFSTSGFSIKRSWDTDIQSLFEHRFVFDEKFDFEIAHFVVSGVSYTADRWWAVSTTPLASGVR
jgi:hypothetical protein